MKKALFLLLIGWMSVSTSYAQLSAGFYGGSQTINLGSSATIEFRFNGSSPVEFSYTDGANVFVVENVQSSPYYFQVSPSVTTTYQLRKVRNASGYGYIQEGHETVTVVVGNGNNVVQMTFLPPTTMCENANPTDLRSYFTSNVTGTVSFNGDGVIGNIFYPQRAGVGSHYIVANLSYNNSIYSVGRTINVNAMPQVTLWLPNEVFLNEPPFVLSGGRPSGGTYSADYGDDCIVNGNTFDPQRAGVGWHNVYYTYTTTSGCQDVAEAKIYVRMSGNDVEETTEDTFAVYPNPTNGIINFSRPCSVDIFSTICLVRRENSLVESIDISDLSNGIYILRLFDGESYFIKRIVRK